MAAVVSKNDKTIESLCEARSFRPRFDRVCLPEQQIVHMKVFVHCKRALFLFGTRRSVSSFRLLKHFALVVQLQFELNWLYLFGFSLLGKQIEHRISMEHNRNNVTYSVISCNIVLGLCDIAIYMNLTNAQICRHTLHFYIQNQAIIGIFCLKLSFTI